MVDIQNMVEGNVKEWLVLFLLLYEQIIYIYIYFFQNEPSSHMTSIQRRLNVDA